MCPYKHPRRIDAQPGRYAQALSNETTAGAGKGVPFKELVGFGDEAGRHLNKRSRLGWVVDLRLPNRK